MTPSDLEVLIHCHAACDEHPRKNAPAVQQAIGMFLSNGIIMGYNTVAGGNRYQTTERGRAWLGMLLDTPYPVHEWSDPRTKK